MVEDCCKTWNFKNQNLDLIFADITKIVTMFVNPSIKHLPVST